MKIANASDYPANDYFSRFPNSEGHVPGFGPDRTGKWHLKKIDPDHGPSFYFSGKKNLICGTMLNMYKCRILIWLTCGEILIYVNAGGLGPIESPSFSVPGGGALSPTINSVASFQNQDQRDSEDPSLIQNGEEYPSQSSQRGRQVNGSPTGNQNRWHSRLQSQRLPSSVRSQQQGRYNQLLDPQSSQVFQKPNKSIFQSNDPSNQLGSDLDDNAQQDPLRQEEIEYKDYENKDSLGLTTIANLNLLGSGPEPSPSLLGARGTELYNNQPGSNNLQQSGLRGSQNGNLGVIDDQNDLYNIPISRSSIDPRGRITDPQTGRAIETEGANGIASQNINLLPLNKDLSQVDLKDKDTLVPAFRSLTLLPGANIPIDSPPSEPTIVNRNDQIGQGESTLPTQRLDQQDNIDAIQSGQGLGPLGRESLNLGSLPGTQDTSQFDDNDNDDLAQDPRRTSLFSDGTTIDEPPSSDIATSSSLLNSLTTFPLRDFKQKFRQKSIFLDQLRDIQQQNPNLYQEIIREADRSRPDIIRASGIQDGTPGVDKDLDEQPGTVGNGGTTIRGSDINDPRNTISFRPTLDIGQDIGTQPGILTAYGTSTLDPSFDTSVTNQNLKIEFDQKDKLPGFDSSVTNQNLKIEFNQKDKSGFTGGFGSSRTPQGFSPVGATANPSESGFQQISPFGQQPLAFGQPTQYGQQTQSFGQQPAQIGQQLTPYDQRPQQFLQQPTQQLQPTQQFQQKTPEQQFQKSQIRQPSQIPLGREQNQGIGQPGQSQFTQQFQPGFPQPSQQNQRFQGQPFRRGEQQFQQPEQNNQDGIETSTYPLPEAVNGQGTFPQTQFGSQNLQDQLQFPLPQQPAAINPSYQKSDKYGTPASINDRENLQEGISDLSPGQDSSFSQPTLLTPFGNQGEIDGSGRTSSFPGQILPVITQRLDNRRLDQPDPRFSQLPSGSLRQQGIITSPDRQADQGLGDNFYQPGSRFGSSQGGLLSPGEIPGRQGFISPGRQPSIFGPGQQSSPREQDSFQFPGSQISKIKCTPDGLLGQQGISSPGQIQPDSRFTGSSQDGLIQPGGRQQVFISPEGQQGIYGPGQQGFPKQKGTFPALGPQDGTFSPPGQQNILSPEQQQFLNQQQSQGGRITSPTGQLGASPLERDPLRNFMQPGFLQRGTTTQDDKDEEGDKDDKDDKEFDQTTGRGDLRFPGVAGTRADGRGIDSQTQPGIGSGDIADPRFVGQRDGVIGRQLPGIQGVGSGANVDPNFNRQRDGRIGGQQSGTLPGFQGAGAPGQTQQTFGTGGIVGRRPSRIGGAITGRRFGDELDSSDPANAPMLQSISVSCDMSANTMDVAMTFDRPFDGLVYAKNYFKVEICRQVANRQIQIDFRINLDTCGMFTSTTGITPQDRRRWFENVVVIMNNKNAGILEAWDKAYKVSCGASDFGNHQMKLGITVPMLPTIEAPGFEVKLPDTWMKIVRGMDPNADPVTQLVLGEMASLIVIRTDPTTMYDIHLYSCLAHDGSNLLTVELLDVNGCPVHTKIVMPQKKSLISSGELAGILPFNTFKFPDEQNVFFKCEVQLCFDKCVERTCATRLFRGKRELRNWEKDLTLLIRDVNDSLAAIKQNSKITNRVLEATTLNPKTHWSKPLFQSVEVILPEQIDKSDTKRKIIRQNNVDHKNMEMVLKMPQKAVCVSLLMFISVSGLLGIALVTMLGVCIVLAIQRKKKCPEKCSFHKSLCGKGNGVMPTDSYYESENRNKNISVVMVRDEM